MNRNKDRRHTGRNIALLLVLALLCIGGAELAACSHFAPETYERIVAPVRFAAGAAADAGRAGLNAAADFFRAAGEAVSGFIARTGEQAAAFWAELTAPSEDSQENSGQLAEDPVFIADWPAVDPVITELLEINGKQVLTGGNFNIIYFCQSDEAWAEQPYGTDTIGPYGCGPTAMAMAVASMTDTETDPAVMADWAARHGYWASQSGSYHSIVPGTAKAFGLKVESVREWTVDALYEELYSGKVLVALMGPGHFTKLGHFIILRGATLSGHILVADPNSLERSLTLWEPQLILDELAVRAGSGGPLWALSLPEPDAEAMG